MRHSKPGQGRAMAFKCDEQRDADTGRQLLR